MAFLILAPVTHAATFTVTTLVDKLDPAPSSPLSLREALRDAAATPVDPDTIVFAPALNGQTIVLNSEIPVNDVGGVTVDASSLPNGITINGGPGPNRIFLVSHAAPTSLTLRRLTLTGGDGIGTVDPGLNGQGGAIHNRFLGNLTLDRCTLSGNTVGGAIFNAGTLTLTRCTLSGNTTTSSGGAILNALGAATLVQCTLSGNTANSTGGHIANDTTLILRHCTVTGGVAGGGSGGIHNFPTRTMTLERCLATGNISGGSTPSDIVNLGTWNLEGASVVGASSGNPPTPTGAGAIMIPDPPPFNRIGLLLNNGGPTQTHALLLGSPAIDAGAGSSFTTDQRGKPLVGPPDVGAFEAQNGGIFVLSAASHNIFEGDSVTVTIQRTDGFIGTATVRLFTVAGSATAADFTARANTVASDVTFGHGVTSRQVVISTTLDGITEGTHSFTIRLGSPTPVPASTLGTPNAATITMRDAVAVTNLNDSGPGSLRQALATAAANPGADVVAFAAGLSGGTILLASPLYVTDVGGVTVDASNLPAGITIDGSGASISLFYLFDGADPGVPLLHLRGGLTLTGSGTGGAISNNNCTVLLSRCTITGNKGAGAGGGINASGGNTEVTQCTLSGNTSEFSGGAIRISNGATLRLTHSTVSNNSATNLGGGVYAEHNSTVFLHRSIISGNTAPTGADLYSANTQTVVTREGTNVVPVFVNNGGTVNGTGEIVGDPAAVGLNPLASNGGPTRTHSLPPGSPALNTGDGSAFTFDQRGKPMVGDPDVGAYEVQPGHRFVLSATGYSASEGASADVEIKRIEGSGPASVRLFTTAGTAAATADFNPKPNTIASDVPFNDGDGKKTVSISTATDSLVEVNETFTVTLGSPSVGGTIGAPSSAKVAIIDPSAVTGTPSTNDPTRPGVPIITTPASNASLSLDVGAVVVVTGTASDNKGVKSVTAKLNGGPDVPLTLANPGAPVTAFSGSVPGAIAGVNKLTVTASDFITGPPVQSTTSAERTFRVLRPLLVKFGGGGSGSVTAGFVPKSYRVVGAPYTITATPAVGSIFTQWTLRAGAPLDLGIAAMDKPTLTFIHREGVEFTAEIEVNPYASGRAGTYNGLVSPNGATLRRFEVFGYLTATLLPTGAFSGTLKIDGLTLPFAGAFDISGTARFGTARATTFQLPRPNNTSLTLALAMNLAPGAAPVITGTVTQHSATAVTSTSLVNADKAVFSATTPVPTNPYLTASGGTATYTMIFRPNSSGSMTPDQVPRGTGYGTFTLSRTGIVTLAAKLADNTAITQTTTLNQLGQWPIFVQMYPGLKGLCTGQLAAFNFPATDFSGGIAWYCPVIDRQHYSLGWSHGTSNMVTVTISAAKYTIPTGHSVVPLTEDPGTGNGTATLNFTNGLLTSSLAKSVIISRADAVTKVPAVDPSYTLSINRTTGVVSGTFLHSDGTRPAFNGIVYQKVGGLEGAHGFFMTTTPVPKSYDGQSGGVLLDPQ